MSNWSFRDDVLRGALHYVIVRFQILDPKMLMISVIIENIDKSLTYLTPSTHRQILSIPSRNILNRCIDTLMLTYLHHSLCDYNLINNINKNVSTCTFRNVYLHGDMYTKKIHLILLVM